MNCNNQESVEKYVHTKSTKQNSVDPGKRRDPGDDGGGSDELNY